MAARSIDAGRRFDKFVRLCPEISKVDNEKSKLELVLLLFVGEEKINSPPPRPSGAPVKQIDAG